MRHIIEDMESFFCKCSAYFPQAQEERHWHGTVVPFKNGVLVGAKIAGKYEIIGPNCTVL